MKCLRFSKTALRIDFRTAVIAMTAPVRIFCNRQMLIRKIPNRHQAEHLLTEATK